MRDKLLGLKCDDIDVALDGVTVGTFVSSLLSPCCTILFLDWFAKGHAFGQELYSMVRENHRITASLGLIKANPSQSKHLETCNMHLCGLGLDFVNLRCEKYATSRIPTMIFGTAREDALRRDFTINSLFYNLMTDEVEDFTGHGLTDLKQRIVKTPLPALQTFGEDPLRVLRMVRFASRLKFGTCQDAHAAAKHPSIKVS